MLDLDTARVAIMRELDALISGLESEPDWTKPVRCTGWTIADLADHVHRFPDRMAFALTSLGSGEQMPRGERPKDMPRDELLAIMREARPKLQAALDALTPEDLAKPAAMGFASLPGFVALQIAAIEAGLHHNDLMWATGREEPLPDDIARATVMSAGPMAPMLAQGATDKPDAPLAFRIVAPSGTLELVHTGDGWETGTSPDASLCTIEGDDSSVGLFLMGRVPATYSGLKTSGEQSGSYKTYFPGP